MEGGGGHLLPGQRPDWFWATVTQMMTCCIQGMKRILECQYIEAWSRWYQLEQETEATIPRLAKTGENYGEILGTL